MDWADVFILIFSGAEFWKATAGEEFVCYVQNPSYPWNLSDCHIQSIHIRHYVSLYSLVPLSGRCHFLTNQTKFFNILLCFNTNHCCYISLPLFEINIRFKIDFFLEEILEDDDECCVSKVGFQLFRAIQAESFWEVIFLPRFLIPFEISLFFPLNSGERTLSGWIFQHIHILSAT